jgi:hypothetical protein
MCFCQSSWGCGGRHEFNSRDALCYHFVRLRDYPLEADALAGSCPWHCDGTRRCWSQLLLLEPVMECALESQVLCVEKEAAIVDTSAY